MNFLKAYFGLLIGALIFTIILLILAVLGFGIPVAESNYSGDVADIQDNRGIIWETSSVEIKTDSEATEPVTFCIAPGDTSEFIPMLRYAQEENLRVTVTYDRGYFEPPWKCGKGSDRVLTDVEINDGFEEWDDPK
jgi:hypothetical protein